jgi:ABC-type bacteriocin/lantibiotic exporter with double-glycine peptidase domain
MTRSRGRGLVASGRRARTPTRLQMEASECGAVALAIVLEYFGSYAPLAQLRNLCGVSRDGSKASHLIRAARAFGCDARGFRREPHTLARRPMPVIIHWEFNHFVVLEGFGRRRVYLNDPATGPRTVTQEEFDSGFTGIVLELAPSEQFVPQGRRPTLLETFLSRLAGATSASTTS